MSWDVNEEHICGFCLKPLEHDCIYCSAECEDQANEEMIMELPHDSRM